MAQPMLDISMHIKLLSAATDSHHELVEALKMLSKSLLLKNYTADGSNTKDDIEEDFLVSASWDLRIEQAAPASVIFNKDQDIMNSFVFLVFKKRYGWSEEGKICTDGFLYPSPDSLGNDCKEDLISLLDEFKDWFLGQEQVTAGMLIAYKYSIGLAIDLPVVRSQIFFAVFDWLVASTVHTRLLDGECFSLIKDLMLSALGDVWSAIRNNSASKLADMLPLFSTAQLQEIFLSLVQLCGEDDLAWQVHDGASRGILTILCSAKYVEGVSLVGCASQPALCIKLGKDHFASWPAYITSTIEPVLHKMFAHEQQTVRENSSKAFTAYMNKFDVTYTVESFKKLVDHLASGLLEQGSMVMGAYEAEGFLGALLFLVKIIPLEYMLENWSYLSCTLLHYLMHPASAVRQVASSVFKFIAQKAQSYPTVMRLLLQSLCCDWKPDLSCMQRPPHCQSSSDLRTACPLQSSCDVWEWREGRLLAFELILKLIIRNYYFFTFIPPAVPKFEMGLQRSLNGVPVSTQCRRVSALQSSPEEKLKLRRQAWSFSLPQNPSDPSSLDAKRKKSQKYIESIIDLLVSNETRTTETSPEMQPFLPRPVFAADHPFGEFVVECRSLEEVLKRLSLSPLASFDGILNQMFVQVVECLCDTRWELRRMAVQVVPLITETIMFYKLDILRTFWATYLAGSYSKMSYGCCRCLREALVIVLRLKSELESAQHVWKNVLESKPAFDALFGSLAAEIEQHKAFFVDNLSPAHRSKLSIVCIDILMMRRVYFSKNASHDLEICKYFYQFLTDQRKMDSPCRHLSAEDLLSCSLNAEIPGRDSFQILCSCISLCQAHLKHYCQEADSTSLVYLFPVLLRLLPSTENVIDSQQAISCCDAVCCKLKDVLLDSDGRGALECACSEICSIIADKGTMTHIVQQSIGYALCLRRLLAEQFPSRVFIDAVTSRLMETRMCPPAVVAASEEDLTYIRMLSNEIRCSPVVPVHPVGISPDLVDGEESGFPDDVGESLSSFSSGLTAFGVHCHGACDDTTAISESTSDEDSPSDWDSWSEDEESESNLEVILTSFLENLQCCQGVTR